MKNEGAIQVVERLDKIRVIFNTKSLMVIGSH
jgi:hypothetical protein